MPVAVSGVRVVQTFRDFMESSLYTPGLGYYENRVPREDFYTAPELHPAFAGVLAAETIKQLETLEYRGIPGPFMVAEMGAGSGVLARSFCQAVRERHPEWFGRITYMLIERCETQLLAGIRSFIGSGMKILGYADFNDVPSFYGVFLSNELVDAFPIHVLEKRGEKVGELYVEGGNGGTYAERWGEISIPELESYARAVEPSLGEGGRHAVNLEARRWMRQTAEKLRAGGVITADYGKRFSAGEPNPPRTFYRHFTDEALTAKPGRQDLTASVDFEMLIQEGEKCGLRLASYTTLSRFLVDRGIIDWMPASVNSKDWKTYAERNRIKTLLHPDGMGEFFKVLIQEKIS